jgi:hypothetical protein
MRIKSEVVSIGAFFRERLLSARHFETSSLPAAGAELDCGIPSLPQKARQGWGTRLTFPIPTFAKTQKGHPGQRSLPQVQAVLLVVTSPSFAIGMGLI